MLPKPTKNGDVAVQVAPGGGRGTPLVMRGRGRDVKEGSGRGVGTLAGVIKGILDARFYVHRFSYKRLVLDLLVVFVMFLQRVVKAFSGGSFQLVKGPLSEVVTATQAMLWLIYWVEEYKVAPVTAAIQTTMLVVPWAIASYVEWFYYHSAASLTAVFIQHTFIFMFLLLKMYLSVEMPEDDERQKNMYKISIQSAISIPIFYLVGKIFYQFYV